VPRLKDATRQERRTRIAHAALRCFGRAGIHATSMADIVREAGLSSGAIYSHFDTKSDLVRFAMTNLLEDRFTALAGSPAGTTTAGTATPRTLLAQLLSGPATNREQTTLLLQVWAEMAQDPALAAVAQESIARLGQLLTQALADWAQERREAVPGPARVASTTAEWLVTVLFGYSTRLALEPGTDAESLRTELLAAAQER